MNDSSLPVEILESVFEDLISEYTKGIEFKFLPRWYLVPLLRVCKLWHMTSEKHLYQCVSIGKKFPHANAQRNGGILEALPVREVCDVANELLRTLTANPRLAALVEELQLGDEDVSLMRSWTQTSSRIVETCPNLRHVEISGFHPFELDTLTEALKERSLVSFRISPQSNPSPDLEYVDCDPGSLRFFELMESWPKLQIMDIEGFPRFVMEYQPPAFNASQSFNCCPELREIIFTGGWLRDSDLNALRIMCSAVTKLSLPMSTRGNEALDALCGCLRAWSPTLECFKLHILSHGMPYQPLSEALSTLSRLEELQIHTFTVDFGAISNLQHLKRLRFASFLEDEALSRLAGQLEDPTKFPALGHIVVYASDSRSDMERLIDVCLGRRIELQMWDGCAPLSSFVL